MKNFIFLFYLIVFNIAIAFEKQLQIENNNKFIISN